MKICTAWYKDSVGHIYKLANNEDLNNGGNVWFKDSSGNIYLVQDSLRHNLVANAGSDTRNYTHKDASYELINNSEIQVDFHFEYHEHGNNRSGSEFDIVGNKANNGKCLVNILNVENVNINRWYVNGISGNGSEPNFTIQNGNFHMSVQSGADYNAGDASFEIQATARLKTDFI